MPNTSVCMDRFYSGRMEAKVGEDAEKCEVGGQDVKGARAVPGAWGPWSELVRTLDIRPWLSRLGFRQVSQETVVEVSHKDWVNMTGLAWRQLSLAGIDGSSFANLCIKPGALVAGGLRLIHWVDEKLNRG